MSSLRRLGLAELRRRVVQRGVANHTTMIRTDLIYALLETHTVTELRQMASREHIHGRSSMTKSELVAVLGFDQRSQVVVRSKAKDHRRRLADRDRHQRLREREDRRHTMIERELSDRHDDRMVAGGYTYEEKREMSRKRRQLARKRESTHKRLRYSPMKAPTEEEKESILFFGDAGPLDDPDDLVEDTVLVPYYSEFHATMPHLSVQDGAHLSPSMSAFMRTYLPTPHYPTKRLQKWLAAPEQHQESIDYYTTTSGSRRVGRAIAKGQPLPPKVAQFLNLFSQARPLPARTVLLGGVSSHFQPLMDAKKGQRITTEYPMSLTYHIPTAVTFATQYFNASGNMRHDRRLVVVTTADNSVRAIHNASTKEFEVIIQPNTRMYVTNVLRIVLEPNQKITSPTPHKFETPRSFRIVFVSLRAAAAYRSF